MSLTVPPAPRLIQLYARHLSTITPTTYVVTAEQEPFLFGLSIKRFF